MMNSIGRITIGVFLLSTLMTEAQDLYLYSLGSFESEDIEAVGFLSLSDGYGFKEVTSKSFIDKDYLGDMNHGNENFHVLSKENRAAFLEEMWIDDSLSLYVRSLVRDSTFVFPVNELRVVAFLSPYAYGEGIEPYDYMVGFEIPYNMFSSKGEEEIYGEAIACFAYESPFVDGGLVAIEWEEYVGKLPDSCDIEVEEYWSTDFLMDAKSYSFNHEGLTYYLTDQEADNLILARRLLIYEDETSTCVFKRTYWESEGTYLLPLNGTDEYYMDYILQWTGLLFKDQPEVVFGFEGHSFGCPYISLIGHSNRDPIPIFCDNRH